MKLIVCLGCSILLIFSCNNSTSQSVSYSKNDLRKISWIEGNWKGMDGQNPFYEIYKFTNDSSIEITSYEWNGRDSSHSSKSYLSWQNGRYFLGDDQNYSVVEITDKSIYMDPNNKANNSILWKINDANSWMAILKSKNVEKTYKMERVNHFSR
jgi:hypothetical protein